MSAEPSARDRRVASVVWSAVRDIAQRHWSQQEADAWAAADIVRIKVERWLEANPTTEEQELGRRLLATGYVDEHRVEFQESGYGVQHPIECRPDLLGCRFNIWLRDNVGPEDFNPGRYRMDWSDVGPFFEMVSE